MSHLENEAPPPGAPPPHPYREATPEGLVETGGQTPGVWVCPGLRGVRLLAGTPTQQHVDGQAQLPWGEGCGQLSAAWPLPWSHQTMACDVFS